MNTLVHVLLFGFGVSIISGCGFAKDLQSHQSQLLAATGDNVSIAQKRDVLATSMVSMMHDAVDRLNPKQGVKYVKAYAKTNGPIVDTLAAQIKRGQQKMTDAQRISFMLPVFTKPYAKEALSLMPRFINRYKQYQSVIDMTGKLKTAVLGKLGASLGSFGQSSTQRIGSTTGLNRECNTERCTR